MEAIGPQTGKIGSISVYNRQRKIPIALPWLRQMAARALAECREISNDNAHRLRALEEVEVTVVSDAVIARVHQRFMQIPGATDVITFEHGEIVMSAETAEAFAIAHGHTVNEELALYTIHGLLHLNGFEDASADEAARMHQIQTRILQTCLAALPPPL